MAAWMDGWHGWMAWQHGIVARVGGGGGVGGGGVGGGGVGGWLEWRSSGWVGGWRLVGMAVDWLAWRQ
jgi:hypothetical protein